MDAKLSLECLLFKYASDLSQSNKDRGSELDDIHDVLHVQSISHWAPANIGPYSQAHRVNIFHTTRRLYKFLKILNMQNYHYEDVKWFYLKFS